MILKKNAIETNEKVWSIILNPVEGQLARGKAARALAETFSIAEDEARDLIENTPIILLEDLPYAQAQRLRLLLAEKGLELILTDNPLQKRKCFKTIWPNQPRLASLLQDPFPAHAADAGFHRERLAPDEALTHIRQEVIDFSAKIAPLQGSEAFDADYQKRFEALNRQHAFLNQERAIQEKKMEALQQEIRFLREKENRSESEIKTLQSEKDTLAQAFEAARIQGELLRNQSQETAFLETQVKDLQATRESLSERLSALQEEMEESEKLWSEKTVELLRKSEDLLRANETFTAENRELKDRVKFLEKKQEQTVAEENLAWCEKILREKVGQQDNLEQEIRGKEKLLKTVLAEQEKLETEMLRFKNAKNKPLG